MPVIDLSEEIQFKITKDRTLTLQPLTKGRVVELNKLQEAAKKKLEHAKAEFAKANNISISEVQDSDIGSIEDLDYLYGQAAIIFGGKPEEYTDLDVSRLTKAVSQAMRIGKEEAENNSQKKTG